ncbi:MAG: DUF1887 family protein [Spirochaetales bacterium]|nr:DUF1887 family protein [Spirochaetales bacterium]
MSKVHITLVGSQKMPVYNGIKYIEPDTVVFIASPESQSDVKFIMQEFVGSKINFVTEILDAVDIPVVADKALKLSEKYKNDEVSVNITSGTKIWSCYFTMMFFQSLNASIFYIDQNNKIWDFVHPEKQAFVPFDMFVQFRLNGNPLTKYTMLSDYTDEDIDNIRKIEEIRHLNQDIFNKLTILSKGDNATLESNNKGTFYVKDKSSYVFWDKKKCSVRFVIKTAKKEIDETLVSPNIIKLVFNSGWFEVKCADILSKWQVVTRDNIYLNCVFPVEKHHNQCNDKFPKNEVDIIIKMGDKLLFVECKTQIFESTDIDKFNTVVRNYGGMGSKGLFLTEYAKTDIHLTKIKESNLIEFSLLEHSGGKRKQYKDVQELYNLLDRELYKINKK